MNLANFINQAIIDQVLEIMSRQDLSNEQKIDVIKFIIEY